MKRLRKICSLAIMVCLLLLPATAQGAEKGKAIKQEIKSFTSILKNVAEPKKDQSLNPADYPLKEGGNYVGSLYDYYGYHYITFESITNYGTNQMDFKILYQSDYYNIKDSIVTMEFYKENNNTLQFYGYTEFDTYGENALNLHSYLDKSVYTDKQYIYVRLGISETKYDEYYTDTLLFKVKNPYYTNNSDPNPNPATGKYSIISNESVNDEQSEYTGSFKINNNQYAQNKRLSLDSYKMDVNKPFNIEKNKNKKVRKSSFLPNLSYQVGDNKNFWVTNLFSNVDYQINSKLLYSGSKANVWVYNNLITSQDADKLGKEFDNKIYQTITNNFAPVSDVDQDGKINILCYDIQDGFNGSGGYVAGYFWGGDLYNIDHSNQSEIFYIDTYPAMGTGSSKDVTAAYETLTHEFQHMVNFNQNVFIEGSEEAMDPWLNEGLSMAAEQIYSGNVLSDRINYYNSTNSTANGHSLLYWDYDGDTLANYSLSYLFSQYVKLQANKGNSIFKEILLDSNNDYKAVEDIVQKYINPTMTFGKFMTNFRAALFLKQDTGLYGFKGVPEFNQLQPRLYSGYGMNLKGGGAIVKQIDSQDFVVPANKGTDITYTFVDNDSTPPVIPTVDPVGDKDTTVKGKAEPTSLVSVKSGTALLGSAYADMDGNFSIIIAKQKAGTTLTVFAKDAAGNKSEDVTVTVADKTAPAAPTVNEVKDTDKKVTGKAEAYSKVTVKIGSTTLGEATTDKYGNFSVTLKIAQKAGTVLSVTAADKTGNISTSTLVTVEDKTVPIAPNVNEVKDYDKKVTGKAEAYSKVTVKTGRTTLGYANADKYGNFTVTLKAAQKAGTILSLTAADKNGNVSTATLVTVKDKTLPGNPVVNEVKDYDKKVTGKAEAYSKITVKTGRTTLGYANTDKYGNFTVTLKTAQKAGTILLVTATDKAGNVSKSTQVIVKDKTAPSAPKVNKVTARSTTVTGKTEAYATVYVKSGSRVIGTATASKSGNFTVKIAKQKKGTILYIYAKDKGGNTSKSVKMTVQS
jgi:large repetitive protein